MSSPSPSTSPRPEVLAQCDDSQVSVCGEDIVQRKYNEQMPFMEFLNIPHEHLPLKTPESPYINGQVTLDTFLDVINTLARFMRDLYFPNKDLLVFKFTRSQSHGGHVTAADCKPDYTAAFMSDWGDKNTTLWPCIQLIGEKAPQGKNHKEQEIQAMSYLGYLLLARPDLYVTQGLFTSDSDVMFLLGIGGVGIHTFSVGWDSKDLHNLIYAFIYRLYDPGHFADPSYVKMVPNLKENFVTYNMQITEVNGTKRNPITISNFHPIYASNPFGTRTHILSNPNSDVKINGEPLTVLKEQLCKVGTQLHEYRILTQVHSPGKVPGVVEAVYHEVIKIPGDFCPSSEKHRMGLRQIGVPVMSVRTVAQMLEIVFDILEVLRYLRFERHVLHRDISIGNILKVKDDLPSSTGAQSGEAETNEMAGPNLLPLCFIKYILGESDDPQKTSALLIDFNYAENLESKQCLEYEKIAPIGTRAFMARAVLLGRAVPHKDEILYIPEVPRCVERYEACHPDRIEKFPYKLREFSPVSMDGTELQWRHELDHDTESVFWVLLYWLITAQPEGEEKEPISAYVWAMFAGSANSRIHMLKGGLSGLDDVTHSVFKSLRPMLTELARIINIDRHWIESSDPRKDPGYTNEAFRRLIVQFILEHRDEAFMQHRVGSELRRTERMSGFMSSSSDASGKRSLSEPSISGGTKRLLVAEDSPDGDDSEDQFAGEVEEDWVGMDEEE